MFSTIVNLSRTAQNDVRAMTAEQPEGVVAHSLVDGHFVWQARGCFFPAGAWVVAFDDAYNQMRRAHDALTTAMGAAAAAAAAASQARSKVEWELAVFCLIMVRWLRLVYIDGHGAGGGGER